RSGGGPACRGSERQRDLADEILVEGVLRDVGLVAEIEAQAVRLLRSQAQPEADLRAARVLLALDPEVLHRVDAAPQARREVASVALDAAPPGDVEGRTPDARHPLEPGAEIGLVLVDGREPQTGPQRADLVVAIVDREAEAPGLALADRVLADPGPVEADQRL